MERVKIFNYGIHSATDFWILIAKPDLDEYREKLSPRAAAHVVQTLWGLWEWICAEQNKNKYDIPSGLMELQWIKEIAESAKHMWRDNPNRETKSLQARDNGQAYYGTAGFYGVPIGGYGSRHPSIILDDKNNTEYNFTDVVEVVAKELYSRLKP